GGRHHPALDVGGLALPSRGDRRVLPTGGGLGDGRADHHRARRLSAGDGASQPPAGPGRGPSLRPGPATWVQGVVATPAWRDLSSSFRASAGVLQPRVFLGRELSVAATASRSAWP